MARFEHDAVISGIGQSAVGRRLGRSALDLTTDAALKAIDDAGLTRADIDGVSTYPGGDAWASRGYGGPRSEDVQDALRLKLDWYQGAAETPGQLGALVSACLAISAGLATNVVVYRTVTESSAQGTGSRAAVLASRHERYASGLDYWLAPFGAVSATNWLAMVAARHFHAYGTTREHLGAIALTQRANAALNPDAVLRAPMSMDDYLAARMISTPLGLFDCDIPVDGSTAFVLSRRETAGNGRSAPVYIDAVGTALRGRPSWDQYEDMASMAAAGAADHLWRRSTLRPSDVDAVQLYDGFSILALVWLEAMGFCPRGEGGRFVAGGHRIARDGVLPMNTGGGQLSAGRLHGFGHIFEACRQLRGAAGAHQLAKRPDVVAVANGGGPIAGCLLLTAGPT